MDDPNRQRYGWGPLLVGGAALNIAAQLLGPSKWAKREYAKSTRPPFAPPPWLFAVAWPVNNVLTIWGNREVLNAPPSADRTAYLRLQAAAWLLFTTYGLARFRLKSPLLGYFNTTLYCAAVAASAARAARIDRGLLASYATLVPWLAFAMILSLYQLNDDDPLFDR